ncbi:ImmA/IrrE family metallo-endopeptidase [Streptomyces sp. NPDC012888]|uniref:ImmA/IrrE family metallo-endopeptidase n=1 Tax=Streptomyces sp. NPDC012888 TaxID=3364855 RepID=UPI0036983722
MTPGRTRTEGRRLRRRLKKVRRSCELLLGQWGMEHGCGIEEFRAYLSTRRRRPIHLLPTAFPDPHLFGMWLKMDDFDIVAFEESASPSHKEHIIAHELAHIALDHNGTALMRSSYSEDEEQEAETMASLILARAAKRWAEPAWGVPAEAADVVARIEEGLGRNVGAGGNGPGNLGTGGNGLGADGPGGNLGAGANGLGGNGSGAPGQGRA